MTAFDLIFGFLLLLAGRNSFWLCVGIIGFLIGVQCAELLGPSNGWSELVSAFALGSAGVVLAMCFEWVAVIWGVGFLGGGYLLMNLFPLTIGQGPYAWPVFVVGGIIGMCLMVIIFDWALIIISASLGALLIVNAIHVPEQFRNTLFISIMLIGIAVQYLNLKDAPKQKYFIRRA